MGNCGHNKVYESLNTHYTNTQLIHSRVSIISYLLMCWIIRVFAWLLLLSNHDLDREPTQHSHSTGYLVGYV